MLDIAQSYDTIRSSAGVYSRATTVLSITGSHRQRFVSALCAKRTEYAEPGTVIESIVLNDDGAVRDILLVVVEDERTLLVCDRPFTIDLTAEALVALSSEVRITDLSHRFSGAAIEGPRAWVAVQHVIDDVSSLLLNEFREVGPGGASGLLIRVGTTAEYGYLLLLEGDVSPSAAVDLLTPLAESIGGGLVSDDAVKLAKAEVSHPLVPEQFEGLTVAEAGALWTLSTDREDEFVGRGFLSYDPPSRRIVALRLPGSDAPVAGTAVTAGGTVVGSVKVALATAESDGFALAILDAPFNVPGLDLEVDGRRALTVSRPAAAVRSWVEPMGA